MLIQACLLHIHTFCLHFIMLRWDEKSKSKGKEQFCILNAKFRRHRFYRLLLKELMILY